MLLHPMDLRLSMGLLLNSLIMLLSNSLVQGQNSSSFDFLTFNSTDKLLINRDAKYMPNSSSIWLNPSHTGSNNGNNFSCGELIYADIMQMRDSSNASTGSPPAVASFNTSFTFSMIGGNSAGMAFMFAVGNHTTGGSGASLCLLLKPQNDLASNHLLAVDFDTWKNPEFNDSSNNHVGVNINSMNSRAVHNLCGDGITDCNYLVTNQNFTTWIDYDSATQILDVFLTKGSLVPGVPKPADPIIQVPNLDLRNVFNDYMFVGFTGSGAMYREVKKTTNWRFKTGSFMAGNGADIIPAPAPVLGDTKQGSKRSWVGLIAGVVSAVCGLVIAILCVICWFFWRGVKSGSDGDAEEALSMEFSSSANMAETCNQLLGPQAFSFQELNVVTNGFSEDRSFG